MKVTALAGGVGGAKLLAGLARAVGDGRLTAIVNTGDDATVYGLHVAPDVDIVTYWLAGRADTDRGWGLRDDTFRVVDALGELGAETWFRLGDVDLATCLYRTVRLAGGAPLGAVADEVRRRLGVTARILPMSDDAVRTHVVCVDGRTLEFQEWFVRERCEPVVREVTFVGMSDAKPAPGVVDALDEADVVVVCPSNPIVSIGPIVSLPGVRDRLRSHARVVAVSPLINGAALKGPADKLLASLGQDPSAAGVASLYADFCDEFVIDTTDETAAEEVESLGVRCSRTNTIMVDAGASTALATTLLRP